MKILFALCLSLCSLIGLAQFGESVFYRNDTLILESEVLDRSITIPLFLPMEHFYIGEDAQLPLILIFDSQHTLTFPYHLHSIDAMTTQVQMPASVVAGIPFGRDRTYLTSDSKKEGESMSGQEKMEAFLWDELIPALEAQYHAYPKPLIIGHSRSAYLVSWLAAHKPDKYAMTLAASGFFEPGFEQEDALQMIRSMESSNPGARFFFSNGTLMEEAPYQEDYHHLSEHFYQNKVEAGWDYQEFEGAGHMANYQLSLPWALTTFFEPYARVLDHWLFDKMMNTPPHAKEAVGVLQKEMEACSATLGIPVLPRVIHFFSIGSYYANNNAPEGWEAFMKDANRVYPKDYVYAYLLGEIAKEKDDLEAQKKFYQIARQSLDQDPFLNIEDRSYAEEEVRSIKP